MVFLHHTKAILLLLLSIFALIISTKTHPAYIYHGCLDSPTETTSASYITNLNSIFNTLSTKSAEKITFYKETSNEIYALYNCRGDVTNDMCQKCVEDASASLIERCPSNKTAIIWYDECILRYSNTSFFGSPDVSPALLMWNVGGGNQSTGKQETGEQALMYDLIDKVPYEDTMFLSSKRAVSGDESKFRYGLMLCTRDLSSVSCKTCLEKLSNEIPKGYFGWRVVAPSCYMRYETYLFFNEPVVAPTPAAAQPPPGVDVTGGGNNTAMIVGITVSSIAVFAAVLGFCFYRFHKKHRPEDTESQEFLDGDLEDPNHAYFMEAGINGSNQDHTGEMQYFRLTTIMAATNNFSDSNKLGEGGFGPVYKGTLVDGKEIAVKRLSLKSGQGLEEFKNEVMFIVKLQHKNLVRLLGCSVERNEKLLVYEYLANTSLDVFLFDQEKCKQLDWDKRTNIVSGIAKGIQYLHEDSRLKIIHRDLKASNVLLDDEMNPKISDFGTARMFAANQIEANTNKPVGTYGYMAPEYAMEGLFSMKSDVYSFGILLLEIVSGKKNNGFNQTDHAHTQSLLSYVWQLWDEGKGQELIDQNIIDTCSKSEALRWIHIALLCVQEDPNDRPSISSVILMLGSKMSDLPRPSAPVGRFFMSDLSSTTTSGAGTGFLASDQSSTSASLFRLDID